VLQEARDLSQTGIPAPAFWRERLAPYATPRIRRGVQDLATSVIPYLVLTAAAYVLLPVSDLFALAFALPAAGFLLRTFIVFHDCTHGSFLPSRAANRPRCVIKGAVSPDPGLWGVIDW
jgi:omega-6 fatty acid desaturase (delta-12 desaturase)